MPRLARTLTSLAKVQAATGDHVAARQSRREARGLLEALGEPMSDGKAWRPAKPTAATPS